MRVLVVDDTVLYRKIVSDTLTELPDIEIVGTASNGKIALDRILSLRPDLITLDIEMPEMDGLDLLKALKDRKIEIGVIVLSAVTKKGGDLTMRALELGAFDFVTKPAGSSLDSSKAAIRNELLPMVKAYDHRRQVRSMLRGAPGAPPPVSRNPRPAPPANLSAVADRMNRISSSPKPEMVLIGISTGGPNALALMLPQLPKDMSVPVLIVQHMPPLFTQSLAERLDNKSAITVREAQDGDVIKAGTAYIAPGGKQMRLSPGPDGTKVISINDDPPINNCKPSVDYLFRSVAHHFPGRASAVIMTGMGSDGTMGLRLLKRHGCHSIAQEEASCVVYGMPKEAIEAGVIDVVAPLENIANEICRSVKRLKA